MNRGPAPGTEVLESLAVSFYTQGMNIKKLTSLFLIVSCFILSGCGKKSAVSEDSSMGLLGCTIAVKTYDGSGITAVDVESNSYMTVPEGQDIKIICLFDASSIYRAETIVNDERHIIEGDLDHLLFSYETCLTALSDAAEAKGYARSVISNPDCQFTNEQVLNLYIRFMEKLPPDFLSTYNRNDSKSHIIGSIFEKIFHLYNRDGDPRDNRFTTPVHLAAEKANEQFLRDVSFSSYYFLNSLDENGRTPLTRAVIKGNLEACRFFYNIDYAKSMVKDDSGKTFVDYSRESSNKAIRDLFSIFEINPDELVPTFLPLLVERQMSENFIAIDFKTFEVPYTLWTRAVSKNLHIEANSREEFFSELAVQEEMNLLAELDVSAQGEDALAAEENVTEDRELQVCLNQSGQADQPDKDKFPDIFLPSNIAFVFERDDEGDINYEMKLRVRDNPSTQGKEVGLLEYGTKVTVLEKSEFPEVIGDVSDFWYKIKTDKTEGWCFGGFLVVALENRNCKKIIESKCHHWSTQLEFAKHSYAIAGADTLITDKDGKTYPVKAYDTLEIIKAVPQRNSINPETELDFYAFNPDLESYENCGFVNYPYYIVRDKENHLGFTSGLNLAHTAINDEADETSVYLLSFNKGYGVYAEMFEYNTDTKKSRKYNFTEPEGGLYYGKPSAFTLGYNPRTDEYDYPIVYVRDTFKFTATIGPAEGVKTDVKVICFYTYCMGEMGEDETFYQVYSITDKVAARSLAATGYYWSNDGRDTFGRCYLELNKNKDGSMVAEKIESYRLNYDGVIEEGSHLEYYTWFEGDMVFYKTDEKNTDYVEDMGR